MCIVALYSWRISKKNGFAVVIYFRNGSMLTLTAWAFTFKNQRRYCTLFKQKITSGIDACACFVGYELIIQNDEEKQQTREIIS